MVRVILPSRREWQDEFADLIRGASGGFLFGIPLLYTMEVWWIGSYTSPPVLLLLLAITYGIVFLLNRTDGFRQINSDHPLQAATDSIEAIAIGTFCVTTVLILLQEVTLLTPLDEALGKIILEGLPFAIGVALARSILKGDQDQDKAQNQDQSQEQDSNPDQIQNSDNQNSSEIRIEQEAQKLRSHPPDAKSGKFNATLADVGATLIGTIFIAFNIAPTDEVPMLVAAASPPWLIAIILTSLVISYSIVFVAGFTTQQQRQQQQGLFQHPLTETFMSYLISLIAAAFMLWFFHRLSLEDPWTSWLNYTIILGLPATVGGAAGRLAV